MMNNDDFPEILTTFFSKYMSSQRGLSTNTIKAYRDTFVLLFRFLTEKKKIKPEQLTFIEFNRQMVLDFMEWLETENGSSVATRNNRLAAIHALTRYAMMEHPELTEGCKNILSIRSKKFQTRALDYLTIAELKLILAQPKLNTRQGQRDLALLSFLYDSAARVQELIDLTLADIRFDKPATVKLKGKGRKERIIPMMPATAQIISAYIKMDHLSDLKQYLFTNKSGDQLSRSGVSYIINKYVVEAAEQCPSLKLKKVTPHVFRHSKGMHLTAANVNIIYIRDFLGHSSIQVTEQYAKADPTIKRKAIEKASANILPSCRYSKEEQRELLGFLRSLV
jgi:site-specific recombinase XerD